MKTLPSKMDVDRFLSVFGSVTEHMPWVARCVFDTGLTEAEDTPEGLARAFGDCILGLDAGRQMAILKAHPELATSVADPGLAPDSAREQRSAGLDQCSKAEYREFAVLNSAYRTRFGFPFILAVAGHDRGSILSSFRLRLENSRVEEIETALEQVLNIIALRIGERFDG